MSVSLNHSLTQYSRAWNYCYLFRPLTFQNSLLEMVCGATAKHISCLDCLWSGRRATVSTVGWAKVKNILCMMLQAVDRRGFSGDGGSLVLLKVIFYF